MQDIIFKKQVVHGIFHYIHVSPFSKTEEITQSKAQEILYKQKLHAFLGLGEFLTENLNKYILIRKSPSLLDVPFLKASITTDWKYLLLSSDKNGLGVDHGFMSAHEFIGGISQLFGLESLLSLCDLPEDTFGDNYSYVTVFGLAGNTLQHLEALLQSNKQPELSKFLMPNEVFYHMKIGKSNWAHDSLLVKSREDIEGKLSAYFNIINPNN
ncbi:hypothetical protein SAMN04488132_105110 [Sediminibacterium ginsengisoli]|uniref:Uncharacterized protein n=2 Tax=Sediminibacterium ginsengisoli TaxID=413434 RepID=A0A1T4P402_9BACT|nr:hypothetical protein SAMN04488132_105110 [Sediminibacterium ginsengisoli]